MALCFLNFYSKITFLKFFEWKHFSNVFVPHLEVNTSDVLSHCLNFQDERARHNTVCALQKLFWKWLLKCRILVCRAYFLAPKVPLKFWTLPKFNGLGADHQILKILACSPIDDLNWAAQLWKIKELKPTLLNTIQGELGQTWPPNRWTHTFKTALSIFMKFLNSYIIARLIVFKKFRYSSFEKFFIARSVCWAGWVRLDLTSPPKSSFFYLLEIKEQRNKKGYSEESLIWLNDIVQRYFGADPPNFLEFYVPLPTPFYCIFINIFSKIFEIWSFMSGNFFRKIS